MGQTQTSKETLLDVLIEHVTSHPIHGLIFFLVLFSTLFSMVSVVLALILFFLIRCARILVLWVLILGALLALGSWLIDGVSFSAVHQLNHAVFIELLQGSTLPLQQGYTWLSALPYGMLLSALLAFLCQQKRGLQKDIKRVAQGKRNLTQRFIRQKPCSARLLSFDFLL